MRTELTAVFCEHSTNQNSTNRKPEDRVWHRVKVANPEQMWDTVDLYTTDDFQLQHVPAPGTPVKVTVDISMFGRNSRVGLAGLQAIRG